MKFYVVPFRCTHRKWPAADVTTQFLDGGQQHRLVLHPEEQNDKTNKSSREHRAQEWSFLRWRFYCSDNSSSGSSNQKSVVVHAYCAPFNGRFVLLL